jgi:hypothetical protein
MVIYYTHFKNNILRICSILLYVSEFKKIDFAAEESIVMLACEKLYETSLITRNSRKEDNLCLMQGANSCFTAFIFHFPLNVFMSCVVLKNESENNLTAF